MAQSLYSYPVRIGKHIVCIYKQLVGVNPEPPSSCKTKKVRKEKRNLIK